MYSKITSTIEKAKEGFSTIENERKRVLASLANFIQKKIDNGETIKLIYVCTHNSRRSHFGQVWGKVAADYFKVPNVATYSAGTESTAFNPNAIKALVALGFEIKSNGGNENPVYEVKYSEDSFALDCFSKTYAHESIPKKGLIAVMTCTEADGNCPVIPGTELRISCPYVDPKVSDGTTQQEQTYVERCMQIGTECLFVFSLLKI